MVAANGHVHGWSVVLPLKRGMFAKSRLAPYAGPHRPDLARAMAVDTVRAVLACAEVAEAIVVTSDPPAAAELAALGARVVEDLPDDGLNPALVHGAGLAIGAPHTPRAALSADLPALRPEDLAVTLRAARGHALSFVPDHDGVGTTLFCAAPGVPFAPRYGLGSAGQHRSIGAVDLIAAPSLRRDVDTEADLGAALGLGVGPRTLAVVGVLNTSRGA